MKSSLTITLVAAAVVFGMFSPAHTADQGHGKVTSTGVIIDAPYSVALESACQTVELNQISRNCMPVG